MEGTISGGGDQFNGAEFAGGMSAQGYTIDPQTGVAIPQGNQIAVGASICQGAGFSGCNQPGLSVLTNLSIVLNVDPQHDLFTFNADAVAYAIGNAAADGFHTSGLSIQLSPGVTLDQSNGFLTQTGEPVFGASAPEPSTLGLSVLGLACLAYWQRKVVKKSQVQSRTSHDSSE